MGSGCNCIANDRILWDVPKAPAKCKVQGNVFGAADGHAPEPGDSDTHRPQFRSNQTAGIPGARQKRSFQVRAIGDNGSGAAGERCGAATQLLLPIFRAPSFK